MSVYFTRLGPHQFIGLLFVQFAMSSREKGLIGEDLAVDYLKRAGFKIIDRNFKGLKGEIDIIARNKKGIRFIEVRLRKKNSMVPPASSIIRRKIRKIVSVAKEYLYINRLYGKEDCHFDVITIDEDSGFHVEFIPDAFDGTV